MNITVIGTGYVGLVQAAVMAEVGHTVCCVDIDAEKIKNLKRGVITIHEPGLTQLVRSNTENGRIFFTSDIEEGVAFSRVQFVAVGTPADEDGSADLKYVLAVAMSIGRYMTSPKIIVNKSTVPVGTADKVSKIIRSSLALRDVAIECHVVSNPEFLKEGAAVNDCMRPDRIIVGTENTEVMGVLRELYLPFNRNHDRMIFMDTRSAELTKYAANCMLATKISFMNEIANIAERVGADIENVRRGIGADERIGYHFIYPGCGYGGSCFPKDVKALVRGADEMGYDAEILRAVDATNERQKHKLFEYVVRRFGTTLQGKLFAVWGLSFKPQTDDMREAASRVLMEALWSAGAKIQAYDPEAMDECQRIYGNRDDLLLAGTKEAALQDADALVICTEWQSFRAPDLEVLKSSLHSAVVFDGRNLFEPSRMLENGIEYYSIGRGLSVTCYQS